MECKSQYHQRMSTAPHTRNLTRMECKSVEPVLESVHKDPGILPEWNVNCVGWWLENKEHKPGILPEWNVNSSSRPTCPAALFPGILPEWKIPGSILM